MSNNIIKDYYHKGLRVTLEKINGQFVRKFYDGTKLVKKITYPTDGHYIIEVYNE